ncbi:MAG: VWA domain-containing protein [Proteobacteria bacterium]|nr:VWA domain-containing protein [Pseudomonadota bacterium]
MAVSPPASRRMANDDKLAPRSSRAQLHAFLAEATRTPVRLSEGRGRLLFALDATASREPTWSQACALQAEMFKETTALGGLEVKLCYYRGLGDFGSSPWLEQSEQLLGHMAEVHCVGGLTQIGRVLRHALALSQGARINALVFVGDCVEECTDTLSQLAGKLGLFGIPAFVFQEGHDPRAEQVFRHIAALTRGAYGRFDAGSARQLRDLLRAVAVYAAGGRTALDRHARLKRGAALDLMRQLPGSS